MVSFFFVIQVVNNYAFNYKIPMTLHIIFRAVRTLYTLKYSHTLIVYKH